MQEQSRILVTGAQGLLGSSIVRELKAQGYSNVFDIARHSFDLQNQYAVDSLFDNVKPDYVFHCAARVSGIAANTNGLDCLYNMQMQTNVIRASWEHSVAGFFFPLSANCYSGAPGVYTEQDLGMGQLEPTSRGYAHAKIAGMNLLQNLEVPHVNLVIPNLYGPGDKLGEHVVVSMIEKVLRADGVVNFWGDGSAQREFLYIDDCAGAAIHCMKNHAFGTYNVSTGVSTSIRELAMLIANECKFGGFVKWDSDAPVGTLGRKLDVSAITAQGWRSTVDLETGIKRTIQYVRDCIEL